MQDPNILHVMAKENHEDLLIIFAVPDSHNLSYVSGFDVILVIDLESFQPDQKVINFVCDLVPPDNRLDQSIVFPHLQNIFEKNSQEVRSHISVLFLHVAWSPFTSWNLIDGRLWLKLSFFFFGGNLLENGSRGHFWAVLVILSLWVEDLCQGKSWCEIKAWVKSIISR